MNAAQQLDLYCERLGPGLWAEPLNAFSNLAFLIAAYLLFRRLRDKDRGLAFLSLLIAPVAMGSFAFHTFATVWAHWLDLLFIELFIYCFFGFYLRRIFGFSWLALVATLLGYTVFEWAMTRAFAPGAFNGSYFYFPAWAAIVGMGVAATKRSPSAAKALACAAGVLTVAIVLRSVDMSMCAQWPSGTHFLWHTLNAVVLYCCVSALRGNLAHR